MVKILLVEDSAIVRRGLCQLISAQPDLLVMSEAVNGTSAMNLIESGLLPDIILTDLNMPLMSGFELIDRLQAIKCKARVIILTMHRYSNYINKALLLGAKGYLLKGEDEQELFAGIRAVHRGEVFISSGLIN